LQVIFFFALVLLPEPDAGLERTGNLMTNDWDRSFTELIFLIPIEGELRAQKK
jgi:hypothetical protein